MVEWMGRNFVFSLVSRKFLAMRNIVLYSVHMYLIVSHRFHKLLFVHPYFDCFLRL